MRAAFPSRNFRPFFVPLSGERDIFIRGWSAEHGCCLGLTSDRPEECSRFMEKRNVVCFSTVPKPIKKASVFFDGGLSHPWKGKLHDAVFTGPFVVILLFGLGVVEIHIAEGNEDG